MAFQNHQIQQTVVATRSQSDKRMYFIKNGQHYIDIYQLITRKTYICFHRKTLLELSFLQMKCITVLLLAQKFMGHRQCSFFSPIRLQHCQCHGDRQMVQACHSWQLAMSESCLYRSRIQYCNALNKFLWPSYEEHKGSHTK